MGRVLVLAGFLKNVSQHLIYRISFSQRIVPFHLHSGSTLTTQTSFKIYFLFSLALKKERKSEEQKKTKNNSTGYDATQ